MKLINSVIYSSFISYLFISATQAAADPICDVTAQSFAHIQQRHCTAGVQASQFLPQYCATIQDAQQFCEQVQNATNKSRTVQPDSRIRYDANLGWVVGTQQEKCARLIIKPNGEVVTQFPELNGAPGNCF